mgnify:CR=1 FL=1
MFKYIVGIIVVLAFLGQMIDDIRFDKRYLFSIFIGYTILYGENFLNYQKYFDESTTFQENFFSLVSFIMIGAFLGYLLIELPYEFYNRKPRNNIG